MLLISEKEQELAEAGITVTIETVDSATLFAGMADGKYDMAIASHTPGALPLWFTESRFTADNNLFHVAELTPYTQAIAAVKAGSGTAAAVVYTGDVNATGKVDVNDAQLVYNIYNTEYASFDALSRAKFLAADVNGDHTVTVLDAAAVVNTVLGK